MNIIYKGLEEIHPYANNPRNNDDAVEAVANSIKEFGFKVPIIIDKNGEIIAGHTRYKASMRLGLTEVPCIIADDLTEDQVKAFRIADNKVAEIATWDLDALKIELEDIQIDMSDFGFDIDIKDEDPQIVEDDFEQEERDPVCKLGDIWQLGKHRLMCGDATSEDDVKKLTNDAKINMVYCDPPYGMNLDTDFSSMKNHLDFANQKGFIGGKKYRSGMVDEFSPKMIESVMSIDSDETFMWGADYYAEMLKNRNDGSWFVWDKRSNGNDDIESDYSSDKMYGSCFELCWSKKRHKRDIARVKWAGVFGVEQEFDKKRYHPTQKPIGLSSWFIGRYSTEGDIVCDLFGGSGSTLIACEQLNRRCFMMELDPIYCDVIIQRWEKFTGESAVLLNG